MTQEIQTLLNTLRDSDWWDRRKAIQKLLEYPEDRYAGFLSAALRNHEDANLRNAAMEVYTALGERALPLLTPMTEDDDPEVRLFCVNILGEIGSMQAVPLLCQRIKDDDENVRIASAESLGKIGDAGAIGVLRKALEQDAWMAMAALHAIGNIGGSPSLEILYSCLSNEMLREFALSAIELAGDATSIAPLAELIRDVDDEIHRELALKAMVGITHRKGLPIDADTLSGLVPRLIALTASQDPAVREAAFDTLTRSGDERAVPVFIEAIQTDETREYGVDGLLAIGAAAVPGIRNAMEKLGAQERDLLQDILCKLGETDACVETPKT